jgi:hypothetical protein
MGAKTSGLKGPSMSKISDLAQTFQQKSAQLANDTETALKIDFNTHEKSIKKALSESADTIENAIKDHTKNQTWLLLKSWMIVVIALVTLILLAWGTIWYQGSVIVENYQKITEQNRALDTLEKKGGKIKFSTCGEKGRLCAQVRKDLGEFGQNNENLMILKGY